MKGAVKKQPIKKQEFITAMDSCFNVKKVAGSVEEPATGCYNVTTMKQKNIQKYNTPIQLKLPVDMEKIIKITDAVYTFNEVMEHIYLNRYFVEKGHKTGRPK